MSDYRRYFVAGGTYFFTVVTERRARLFGSAADGRLLGDTMRECLVRRPRDWDWSTFRRWDAPVTGTSGGGGTDH